MVVRGGEKWCKVVPKGEPDPIRPLELKVELGGRGTRAMNQVYPVLVD